MGRAARAWHRSWKHSRGTRRRPIWCTTTMAPRAGLHKSSRADGVRDRPISPRWPYAKCANGAQAHHRASAQMTCARKDVRRDSCDGRACTRRAELSTQGGRRNPPTLTRRSQSRVFADRVHELCRAKPAYLKRNSAIVAAGPANQRGVCARPDCNRVASSR